MQRVRRISFVAMLLVVTCFYAHAQTDLNEVHVLPRIRPAQSGASLSWAKNATGVFRTTVELVLVPVTVMDGEHRIVSGLRQENFQLYENKRPQQIKNFWKEDGPLSIGILLDVSGSMNLKIDRAREAVMALLRSSNLQDEFFLITFADRPTLMQDFTQDVGAIESEMLFGSPKGRTSLLDAIVLGVNSMKKARYRRKALVIISDGGDNRSRYTEKDVKSLIKEADVMVYSIGVFDREVQTREEELGPQLLAGISELTGASAYTLDNPSYLPRIAEHIAQELRNQYILGYAPSNSLRDGKWRKIKVRLAVPRGLSFLNVQARKGYYGPSE